MTIGGKKIEEIEILTAAFSRNWLNDVVKGRSDPVSSLQSVLETSTDDRPSLVTKEIFYQPTSRADDVRLSTKAYRE